MRDVHEVPKCTKSFVGQECERYLRVKRCHDAGELADALRELLD